MKSVIFLGPSLRLSRAREILPDAIYLPPAQEADLLSAVQTHRPDAIGLVDGYFSQSLSVWHKEILFALESGVRVFGASSMGALRAVETSEYGMVGVGEVYRMFASGELNDDDEVALVHGPAEFDYRPLSEPMVNLRLTFRKAFAEGHIDAVALKLLVDAAKALHYPDRTFPRIFEKAAAAGIRQEALSLVARFVETDYVDIKQQDAVLLLETIRDLPESPVEVEPSFTLTRNLLFQTLQERDRTVLRSGTELSLNAIAWHTALHLPEFNALNFQALNRALVLFMADYLQVEVAQDEVDKEVGRFRLAKRLGSDDALADWCRRNDLTDSEFRQLCHDTACCRKLQRWLAGRNIYAGTVKILLDEMRLRGVYETWADRAAEQERTLREGPGRLEQMDLGEGKIRELVIDHLRETDCFMDTHFAEWSSEAGFSDALEFKLELMRAQRARRLQREKDPS